MARRLSAAPIGALLRDDARAARMTQRAMRRGAGAMRHLSLL
jgi:hypothetical protein